MASMTKHKQWKILLCSKLRFKNWFYYLGNYILLTKLHSPLYCPWAVSILLWINVFFSSAFHTECGYDFCQSLDCSHGQFLTDTTDRNNFHLGCKKISKHLNITILCFVILYWLSNSKYWCLMNSLHARCVKQCFLWAAFKLQTIRWHYSILLSQCCQERPKRGKRQVYILINKLLYI